MFYVIGHKSPDTDSICASIAYAHLTKECGSCEITPARLGNLNSETQFVLDKFGFEAPILIESAKEGDKFQLVDHNALDESIEGLKDEMILGVIDHHKLKLTLNSPRYIRMESIGATCTMIARLFMETKKDISKGLAGLMLSAILSDTVIFKSPTSTEIDKKVAQTLAKIAGIENIEEFGIEIKKQKTNFSSMTSNEIIHMDYKEFSTAGKKYSVNQLEVVDSNEVNERKQEILEAMEKNRGDKGLDFSLLMVTDIMKEGTDFWAVGEVSKVEEAYGKKFENGSMWVDGIMSRKKQVIPPIDKTLEN